MSTKQHIDELLKNNLGQLEQAPPPDAWSGIQQGLSNIPPAGTEGVTNSVAAGVKSASVLTKIVVAMVSSAVVAGAYITYTYSAKEKKADTVIASSSQPLAIEQPVTDENPIPKENIETSTEQVITPEKKQSTAVPTHTNTTKGKEATGDNSAKSDPINNSANETGGNAQNVVPTSPIPVADKPQTPSDPMIKSTPESKQSGQPVPVKPKPKHNFDNTDKDKQTGSSDAYVYEPKPNIGSVFTPNGDGKNDQFRIEIDNEIMYELTIYDQDNRKVFESSSKENKWDGTFNNSGIPCDVGTFHYVFNYQYANGKPHTIHGNVLLQKN